MVKQHFPSDTTIQLLIQSRVDEKRAVGIVVGVLESDGSTRIFTAGQAGLEAQPLGERSVFEIGSITKVFTGILLADMVTKLEVAPDDPVAKFLMEDKVKMPTRDGKQITLLDLSTHRSALPRLPDNIAPADETNPYADYTINQMYEFLTNHELSRDIGAEAEYSNLGTGLLGHVLAQINGNTYEELVRERILEPLGMNETAITLSDSMRYWLATGHDEAGNVASNWDVATIEGAGALRSNVHDMLKFIGSNIGPSDSSIKEAMRVSHEVRGSLSETENIGLNWIVMNTTGNKVIWHNGGTGGYNAFVGFDPDRGVGAVVLANSSLDISDIGMHLIDSNMPLTEPPAERFEVEVAADILETYVGNYKLKENFAITVTVNDGALWMQATGQPDFRVYPESATEFFYKVIDAQVTFELDDSGNTTSLVLHQGGMDMMATKQ